MKISEVTFIIVTILYVCIITIASLIPNPVAGEGINYIFHIVEFFILSVLLFNVFKSLKYRYMTSAYLSLLINVIIESSQLLVRYRTFSIYDILAGLFGSSLIFIFKVV